VLAIGCSVLVVAAWFPASALLHQRQAISSTAAQLTQLRQQDQALHAEQQRLKDPAEVARLARQQYQLVSPGQRAYQVLPPNGSSNQTTPFAGDPGVQPAVDPSSTQELPAGSGTSSTTTTTAPAGSTAAGSTTVPTAAGTSGAAHPSTPQSFTQRILATLEFWR
jgi:hypothetical protein